MLVYILFFLSALSTFIISKKSYVYLAFILFYILFLILWGFRWDIGNDYQGLIILNQTNIDDSVSRLREPFFYIVSEIDIYFDSKGFLLVFIYNFFTYSLLFTIFKDSKNKKYFLYFLITSGFVFWANDQVRQALAFVVYLYFLSLLCKYEDLPWKRSLKLIFIGGLLSTSVHFSFALILIATLLVFISIKFNLIKFNIILPVLALFINNFLSTESVFSFIVYLISYLPGDAVDRFLFNPEFYSNDGIKSRGITLYIFTGIFYLLLFSNRKNSTIVYKFFIALISIYLSFYIIFFDFFLLKRLFSIGLYLYFLILPSHYILNRGSWHMVPISSFVNLGFIFLLFLIFLSYIVTEGGRHGGIPYNSLLQYY